MFGIGAGGRDEEEMVGRVEEVGGTGGLVVVPPKADSMQLLMCAALRSSAFGRALEGNS